MRTAAIGLFLFSIFFNRSGSGETVWIPTDLGGNGHTESWDGRLFIHAAAGGWLVRVFRPEVLVKDHEGVVVFNNRSVSRGELIERSGDSGSGMRETNAIAITAEPGYEENPYRSDREGNPDGNGRFSAYKLLVVSQDYENPAKLGFRHATVTVANAGTAFAEVEYARLHGPLQLLTTEDGDHLKGLEPTITFDARFLVWQGHPRNTGDIDVIVYSYNDTPGRLDGWSRPKSITNLYLDRMKNLGGTTIQNLIPLAKSPLKDSSGKQYPFTHEFRGAYPWISLDGTEIFYTATAGGGGRRMGYSVIGRWTGWQARHIDSHGINPDRESTPRLFTSSPGATPGMWQPYKDVRGVPIPYSKARPVYPIFHSNTNNYDEVSFEEYVSKKFALFYNMNELVDREGNLDLSKTPDISGNSNTGSLENGARFSKEAYNRDLYMGARGNAIFFNKNAKVVAPRSRSLYSINRKLTVQFFVKRIRESSSYQYILNFPKHFEFLLEAGGEIHFTVFSNTESRRLLAPVIAMNEWTHVAAIFDAPMGLMRVYYDGRQVAEDRGFGGMIPLSQSTLELGPAGKNDIGFDEVIFGLDEVGISNQILSEDEIERYARYRSNRK